jgi:hypothetical protein
LKNIGYTNIRRIGRRVPSVISSSIRVAIGDVHLPFMTLVRVEQECFLCLHEKKVLPDAVGLVGKEEGFQFNSNLEFKKIPFEHYEIILTAIKVHEEHQGYHINSHSFLVGFCISRGVDLYKEIYLKL